MRCLCLLTKVAWVSIISNECVSTKELVVSWDKLECFGSTAVSSERRITVSNGHEARRGEMRRVGLEASKYTACLAHLVYYTGGLAHLVAHTRQPKARSPCLATRPGELRGCLVLTCLTHQNIWHNGCNSRPHELSILVSTLVATAGHMGLAHWSAHWLQQPVALVVTAGSSGLVHWSSHWLDVTYNSIFGLEIKHFLRYTEPIWPMWLSHSRHTSVARQATTVTRLAYLSEKL